MKIRIRENALRMRITQTELKELLDGKRVVSTIHFPNKTQLTYGLIPVDEDGTSIKYQDGVITIGLGKLDMATMGDEQNVGVQSVHQTENEALNLLIEKDFACLHPRGTDDNDTFPNPNQKEVDNV